MKPQATRWARVTARMLRYPVIAGLAIMASAAAAQAHEVTCDGSDLEESACMATCTATHFTWGGPHDCETAPPPPPPPPKGGGGRDPADKLTDSIIFAAPADPAPVDTPRGGGLLGDVISSYEQPV